MATAAQLITADSCSGMLSATYSGSRLATSSALRVSSVQDATSFRSPKCCSTNPGISLRSEFLGGGGSHQLVFPGRQASFQRRVSSSSSSRRRAAGTVCGVPSIKEAEFEAEVLKAEKPVLVDFWATWCGPCKLVLPIIDWAAEEYDGKLKVIKVETDNGSKFVEQYKVYGLPSIMLFQNGEKVPGSHIEGAITKRRLKEMLDKQLSES